MATSSSRQIIINPAQPNPTSNPRPRARKNGGNYHNNKSKNDSKDKPRRRGVGMAELERLRRLHDHPSSSSSPTDDSRVNPLSGFPVTRYRPISDPRLTNRVAGMPESSSSYTELPSILNPFQKDNHSTHFSFKKKKVIGEEVVGFAKGYNGPFHGYNGDNNNNRYLAVNGGFSAHTTGSEIVAIHRKWSESGNIMMEYGFFPRKSENMKKYNEDSSPSSSSSLSSLSTATTTSSTSSIDLSLKLSSYY